MKYSKILPLIVSLSSALFAVNSIANTVEIKSDSPNEYIVKKGDTLWDIAGVFLKSPTSWPLLWEKNSQINNPHLIYPKDVIYLVYKNGQPFLTTNKSGVVKLSPSVRAGTFSPIQSIPDSVLSSFIQDYRVVDQDRIDLMPYVLSSVKSNKLVSTGDQIYINGVLDSDYLHYDVYRKGKVYDREYGLETNNAEIFKVASLRAITTDLDINTAEVKNADDVIKGGDIVVRSNAMELAPLYYLAAGPSGLGGAIISAVDDAYKISKYDSVVINLGVADGVFSGHVFDIFGEQQFVKDPRTKQNIELPKQNIGKLMVINVFENVSYAIVLSSNDIIPLGAVLKTPN